MKKYFLLIIGVIVILVLSYFVLFFKNQSQNTVNTAPAKNMIKINSSAFVKEQKIPEKFTCDGQNVNPEILIENLPSGSKSLVLIVDDPDAPGGTWTHWVVFNIDPAAKEIAENSVPEGALLGKNSFGKLEYGGPCPPSGTHHYYFKVFALDAVLSIPQGASRRDVEQAMEGYVIDEGQLMGIYSKK